MNRITKVLHDKIKVMKNEMFQSYFKGFFAMDNTDYSLWKAKRLIKRLRIHPIRKEDSTRACYSQEKAKIYARHLENQPNGIVMY